MTTNEKILASAKHTSDQIELARTTSPIYPELNIFHSHNEYRTVIHVSSYIRILRDGVYYLVLLHIKRLLLDPQRDPATVLKDFTLKAYCIQVDYVIPGLDESVHASQEPESERIQYIYNSLI